MKGEDPPKMKEVPFIWYDSFRGWNYLSKFGRPAAMGLVPLSFDTVIAYVERTGLSARHELIRAEQIIIIDIEFVKSIQDK